MKYDFRHPHFEHQQREFDERKDLKVSARLWRQRAGKSKATLDRACYLATMGKIDGGLVIAPSGVTLGWTLQQIPAHQWLSVPTNIFTWDTSRALEPAYRQRFKKMLRSKKFFWFAINSESIWRPEAVRFMRAFLKRRTTLLVVDEADDFSNPAAKRTKYLRAAAPMAEYRDILSGTIILENPLHAFSIFEILKPGALGFKDYKDFRHYFAEFRKTKRPGSRFFEEKLVRFKNLKVLRKRMAKYASVVLREDCPDLSIIEDQIEYIIPTKEQRRIYDTLVEEFIVQIDKDEVSIGENTMRLFKLQQVLSGYLIDEYGDVHRIPGKNPKLRRCMKIVSNAEDKGIIWCNFHAEIDRLVRAFEKRGIPFVEYHGRISKKQREQNLAAFQADNMTWMIANPKAAGRGREMSAARIAIWFSQTFSARTREQARERPTKVGKYTAFNIDLVCPNSVDQYIQKKVAAKKSIFSEIGGVGLKRVLEKMRLR